MGYLIGPEEGSAREREAKQQMLELVSDDRTTYLALFPVAEELFKNKAGAPRYSWTPRCACAAVEVGQESRMAEDRR